MIGNTPFNRALAIMFGAITWLRNTAFDLGLLKQHKAEVPVISVGNIRVGGSGKSPCVQLIVHELCKLGRHPVIVSRGYGGTLSGPTLVEEHSARMVGDEPRMHADHFGTTVPVVVARKRVAGAALVAQRELGDVIVLDDGFQHRRLARDLNCVLVDVSRESLEHHFSSSLLPAGPLREDPVRALKRTDLILLISRVPAPFDYTDSVYRGCPVVRLRLLPGELIDAVTRERSQITTLAEKGIVALSAIARPEYFRDMLERAGAKLKAEMVFPDHHAIGESEYRSASAFGYPVVVTAKDAVKLAGCEKESGKLFILELSMEFDSSGDKQRLQNALQKAIER